MEFIGVALNWRRIGIATLLYRVQGNWLCCILNIIDLFFLTQKHIYSLQYTGCSWFVSFYKCRDITIKNMLFMSLITVRLRDPPSHKDDHRENVQNDFFFFEKLHRKWFQKYRYIWLNDKSVPMTEYQSMLTHAYLSVVQEDMVRCNLNIKTGNW